MSYSWVFTPFVGDVDSLDHQAEAAANVLSQYPDSVRLLAFLDAFVDQAQSLEELSQDILVMRSVYTAEGVQLDTLGDIVGLERGELSDDAYRIFILGKIYANRAGIPHRQGPGAFPSRPRDLRSRCDLSRRSESHHGSHGCRWRVLRVRQHDDR
jgi:hypothetical protein